MEESNVAKQIEKPKETKSGTKKYLSLAFEFLKIVAIAAIIVLPIRYFLFQPFIVRGESMVPNFHSGDYLIVDEISYLVSHPKRGNVIVLRYPLDPSQRFVKRIIGLPGETVDIKDGQITILSNDEKVMLDETQYLPESIETQGNVHTELKGDEYFVLGDNREFSYDSRRWGVLKREHIIGKALLRLFPITQFSLITVPHY